MNAANPLLTVAALTVRFGGVDALSDVSFNVEAGTIHGLIGPNGAGKTTCFNCITRLYAPSSGSIELCGDDLLRYSARDVVGRGVARTFQNGALFAHMPVLDNVLVGLHHRRLPESIAHAEARAMIAYLGLKLAVAQPASGLPNGPRKFVELARALVAKPRLLLLDEPAAGLSREEIEALAVTIEQIRADFGVTILMVEHHTGLVMRVCERIVVLASGRKLAEGPPSVIQNDRSVVEAYLGVV